MKAVMIKSGIHKGQNIHIQLHEIRADIFRKASRRVATSK